MERLVSRVRRLAQFRSVSDVLLLSLLSKSDPVPETIQQGVILFEKDEPTSYWYLLLSGEVELFRRSLRVNEMNLIRTLTSGVLFGDLNTTGHSCSAIVSRTASIVRIHQNYFLTMYNKHGDHLQPFIIIMHDILTDDDMTPIDTCNELSLPLKETNERVEPNLIEFQSNFHSTSSDNKIVDYGRLIQYRMLNDAHRVIRDIHFNNTTLHNCMTGCEMVDWLLSLFVSTSTHSSTLSRLQMSAIWQLLLNNNIISHIDGCHTFTDKSTSIYRWTSHDCVGGDSMELARAITYLSSLAPETLFFMILEKRGFDRTPEELEIIYDELMNIKALAHLSKMVKRQLANVVQLEQYANAGSVVFRQGDPGTHWFIVLKGGVDVSVHGKGVVCQLREGDDFGKLALVNDSPRAATIVTREDDSMFLVIDRCHFNQILQQVEANTVRLREFGEDVLVLEKIEIPRGAAIAEQAQTSCGYSVMAGKAEKILEYVLETRIDAQFNDVADIDVFLEDFLLTHEAFMPTNSVCNYLKNYYFRPSLSKDPLMSTYHDEICAKRRVVDFLCLWSSTLRTNFFLNPVANSFVEEMFCHVIDDEKRIQGMSEIVEKMSQLRSQRELKQLQLSRHPAVVIDCGVLTAHTPIPILPSDICNQIIHLIDTTCFVLPIRVDKTAEEICELTRRRLRCYQSEPLVLVEVKSNGEKLIFSPNDRAIPTVLSLNSKLYVVSRLEVNDLTAMDDQNGPPNGISQEASLVHLIDAEEFAHQLFAFHLELVRATDASELLFQVIGRESFPMSMPYNLDLLVRRFNEVQHWATTEVLLAGDAARVEVLKKFIKIASHAKENQDLLSVFAITLGLSHVSVSRLTLTWSRLSSRVRKKFVEFEALLDPSRNHRAYRLLTSQMPPPYIPFVPLILKDLMFIHQANKTYYNGLVNFEKMHMFANILRQFRQCKSSLMDELVTPNVIESQSLIRNLRVIDNQRRLMQLSYEIEPKSTRRY